MMLTADAWERQPQNGAKKDEKLDDFLSPATGQAAQCGRDGFRIETVKKHHDFPSYLLHPQVRDALIFGRDRRRNKRQAAIDCWILTRYCDCDLDAASISQELRSHGYEVSPGAVEQRIHRMKVRGQKLFEQLGIAAENPDDIPRFDLYQHDPRFRQTPADFRYSDHGISSFKRPSKGWRPTPQDAGRAHVPTHADVERAIDGDKESRVFIEGYGILDQKFLKGLGCLAFRQREALSPAVPASILSMPTGDAVLTDWKGNRYQDSAVRPPKEKKYLAKKRPVHSRYLSEQRKSVSLSSIRGGVLGIRQFQADLEHAIVHLADDADLSAPTI